MKKLQQLLFAVSIISLVTFVSCSDEQTDPPVESSSHRAVLLTNEGGFQQGNASISEYDPATEEIKHDVFMTANNRPVGDVLMPASFVNGDMWLVVNNSGNIWIVDSTDLSIKDEVTGLGSPRFAVKANDQSVYVSNLFGDRLDVVDIAGKSVTGSIGLNGWSEQMVMVNDEIWVANKSAEYLYQVDASTDDITDSIKVRKNGGTIIPVGTGSHVFLLCEAEWDLSTKPCIYRIDLSRKEIIDSLEFAVGQSVTHLVYDPQNDQLLFANAGLHRIDASDLTASTGAINELTDVVVYAIAVDPVNGDIYVSDAGDFTGRSVIHRLSSNGTELSTFEAGVNCNGFVFR